MERDFHKLKTAVNNQLKNMEEKYGELFVANVDNQKLWELYLDSFPEGENPIFRERRTYDCNCCKHFFRNIGNVVALDENNEYITIWDIETGDEVFNKVASVLASEVRKYQISRIFKSELETFGAEDNFDNYMENIQWTHFMYRVPERYMIGAGEKNSFIGNIATRRRLLVEMLENIKDDAIQSVNDLIEDNILYKGAEYKHIIKKLIEVREDYSKVPETQRYNYIWKTIQNIPEEVAKVKNTAIGTLIVNLNEGMDLETAVKKYETVVAPENYKRSKPIYTKEMLERAKKTVEELGYLESLERRYADVDDISLDDVLFVNRNILKKSDGIFGQLEENVTENPRKFENAEKISVEKFLGEVLPNAKEVKVLVENRHAKNFMTMTTAVNPESKSMFKWDNNFAWNYVGGIADSRMKEEVSKKGGDIFGDLRFSIMWNENNENLSDLDAHCKEILSNGKRFEIYYGDKQSEITIGKLDVDIINPEGIAVENITYSQKSRMKDGTYKFFVNYYSKRRGYQSGFKAEVEIEGIVYPYEFTGNPDRDDNVEIAEVTLKNGEFSIRHLLGGGAGKVSSSKIWNINTNQFADVKLVTKSPNCWNEQNQGHEHLFFFIDGCVSEEKPNAIFNEYLKNELYRDHRKVFEAMGQMLKVQETDNQLSGVGFSLTRRNDIIVKVDNKVYRINF